MRGPRRSITPASFSSVLIQLVARRIDQPSIRASEDDGLLQQLMYEHGGREMHRVSAAQWVTLD